MKTILSILAAFALALPAMGQGLSGQSSTVDGFNVVPHGTATNQASAMATNNAGNKVWVPAQAFHAVMGNATTLVSAVYSPIPFIVGSGSSFQEGGGFATNCWKPTCGGRYLISAQILYNATTNAKEYAVFVYKNGATFKAQYVMSSVALGGSEYATPSVTFVDQIDGSGTNAYQVFGIHFAGTGQVVFTGEAYTFFSGSRLP